MDISTRFATRTNSPSTPPITFNAATRLLRSRVYPLAFQIIASLAFVLILWFAFTGNPHGELNLGTVLSWRLWWALLPLSFFAVGKAWCAVCPLALLSDLTHRVSPVTAVMPRWLREHGAWVMAGAFLLLSWAHAIFDIHGSPLLTGFIFLGLGLSAVVLAVRYERRAFCRFVCPIGMMGGMYALTSPVTLRASESACRAGCGKKSCVVAPSCKLYEYPRTLDSNRYCVLCGDCVKECEHNSPRPVLRAPTSELAEIRKPVFAEAVFVILLVGMILSEVVRKTPLYPRLMQSLLEWSPLQDYAVVYSFSLVVLLAALLALAFGVARWSAPAWKPNFARFGYAFIPLALSGHLGINFYELYTGGTRSVQTVIDNLQIPLQLFEMPPMVRGAIYNYIPELMAVQYAVLLLGLAATLIAIWRVGRKTQVRRTPYMLFAGAVAGLFLAVYAFPMKPGC